MKTIGLAVCVFMSCLLSFTGGAFLAQKGWIYVAAAGVAFTFTGQWIYLTWQIATGRRVYRGTKGRS
jgi:hypothetical protein